MPQPAYRDSSFYNNNLTSYEARERYYRGDRPYSVHPETYRPRVAIRPNQKKVNRNMLIHKVISLVFFTLVAMFIIPAMFNKYIKAIPSGSRYAHITTDYENDKSKSTPVFLSRHPPYHNYQMQCVQVLRSFYYTGLLDQCQAPLWKEQDKAAITIRSHKATRPSVA